MVLVKQSSIPLLPDSLDFEESPSPENRKSSITLFTSSKISSASAIVAASSVEMGSVIARFSLFSQLVKNKIPTAKNNRFLSLKYFIFIKLGFIRLTKNYLNYCN